MWSCAGLEGPVQQNGDHACVYLRHVGLGDVAGRAEIMQACAGLGAWPGGDHKCLWILILNYLSEGDCVSLRDGSLGWHSPGWQKSKARGLAIPWWVEQCLCGPMGWGLVCSTGYSFSIWWHGEVFHELGFQSADVSSLLGTLPQSSMSLGSYQSTWITEVRRSVAVFW
jgi:hypothetical protein